MAVQQASRLASALNRTVDATFSADVSQRDRNALSQLIEDFFGSPVDERETEPGKQTVNNIDNMNTFKLVLIGHE